MDLIERVVLLETGWEADLAYSLSSSDLPSPSGSSVLVLVEACGVCHRDLIDRSGRFPFLQLPVTPGHEGSGRVLAVGPDVREWAPGDRVATMHRDSCGACRACLSGSTSLCEGAAFVLGLLADGAYSSHLLLPSSALYSVPEDLPAAEAAVLHCTFGTAYRDLVTLGGLRPGERVLVTGANGGVGSAAVEIASRLGAEVVAVVREARHRSFVEGLGARSVVVDDGRSIHKNPAVGRVDLALDTVGAPTFHSALRSLRIGGRIVVVGNVVPEQVAVNLGYLITSGLTIIGGSGATRDDMRDLLAMHQQQPLRVALDRIMPLSLADAAQRLVRAGGLEGRIVLVPQAAEQA